MDRFELGETWWHAIYVDPRYRTEDKFEVWRKDTKNRCRGVVWAGSAPDGRVQEPACGIVVVVSQRRPRRTATWPLFLPDPTWLPAARQHYVDRRLGGESDWRRVTKESMALASTPDAAPHQVARDALRARLETRRRRRN
jgi:hypothetical protein